MAKRLFALLYLRVITNDCIEASYNILATKSIVGNYQNYKDGSIKVNNYYDAEIKITDRRTVKINGTYIFWYDYSWVSYNKKTGKEEVLHSGIREGTEWVLKEGY